MTSQEEETIHVAKYTFFHAGGLVVKGTTVRIGHPLLDDGRDAIFEPIRVDYDVEDDTTGRHVAPVKRGPGRPRKVVDEEASS